MNLYTLWDNYASKHEMDARVLAQILEDNNLIRIVKNKKGDVCIKTKIHLNQKNIKLALKQWQERYSLLGQWFYSRQAVKRIKELHNKNRITGKL